MANEIKIFSNEEFGNVRTVEVDGKILFCGSDVAKALGYSNSNDAITRHCRCIVKHDIPHPQSPGKTIMVSFVSEGDIYRLITHSKLPSAEKFESWVFDDVLPSIRKTGLYSINQKEDEKAQLLLTVYNGGVEAVVATRELVALETAPLKDKIEEDKPKVDYHDKVLQSKDLMPISVIAKDYGLSAVKLNRILHEEGVQFKQGKTWLLYQDYANQGLTHTKTYTTTTNDGEERTVTHTQWTQKGRHLIHDILKRNGYFSTTEKIALNLLENPIIIKK